MFSGSDATACKSRGDPERRGWAKERRANERTTRPVECVWVWGSRADIDVDRHLGSTRGRTSVDRSDRQRIRRRRPDFRPQDRREFSGCIVPLRLGALPLGLSRPVPEHRRRSPTDDASTRQALPQKYSHYRTVRGDGNCGWRGECRSPRPSSNRVMPWMADRRAGVLIDGRSAQQPSASATSRRSPSSATEAEPCRSWPG